MATSDFLPFATGAGANVMSQADWEALAQRLSGFQSGVAQSAQLNKAWRQASIMAAVLAQFIADQSGEDAVDDGTTATLLANLKAAAGASSVGVVGSMRNGRMSVAAASSTATFTADEIIVETALGGLTYRLPSFSKTINLATTGAGGMDTGTAPANGYVALYAIYNPTTGASALLARNATSSAQPEVYGGANMPAGYTASALVSVWPTNASGQLVIGIQDGREIALAPVTVIASDTTASSMTPTNISVASVVPRNAKHVSGSISITGSAIGDYHLDLYSTTYGAGQRRFSWNSGAAGGQLQNFYGLLMGSAQNIVYAAFVTSGSTLSYQIIISSYGF
ncbi:hypothetical protein K7G19_07170 [Cupriavidus sp. DB3]|uniref:hypothetical protein n=1 Tax=Cupriavidus sp. DB3 TaxID=2873259 RepID=UPI001CF374A9|nr:hypothetical protein [Cupriavidus sp. DB3]MCA7083379.1 hypothetical protein [Cupriavidus sp. DB3]